VIAVQFAKLACPLKLGLADGAFRSSAACRPPMSLVSRTVWK
jgi:hypothetical protein